MKTQFSKKILGKKESTRVLCHRLSVKFYDKGVVIKPISTQGIPVGKVLRGQIENQKAIFLTKETAEYLMICLKGYEDSNKIADTLIEDNIEENKTIGG